MQKTVTCLALLLIATAAGAQERRSPGGGPAPEPREVIAPLARYPYVGTWNGLMKVGGDAMPISLDVTVMNDQYKSVSYGPRGGRMNHLKTELANGVLRWEIKNSGDGVWVYEGTRIVGDTIFGSVKLDGMLGP